LKKSQVESQLLQNQVNDFSARIAAQKQEIAQRDLRLSEQETLMVAYEQACRSLDQSLGA
jgi:hypothetical protein